MFILNLTDGKLEADCDFDFTGYRLLCITHDKTAAGYVSQGDLALAGFSGKTCEIWAEACTVGQIWNNLFS